MQKRLRTTLANQLAAALSVVALSAGLAACGSVAASQSAAARAAEPAASGGSAAASPPSGPPPTGPAASLRTVSPAARQVECPAAGAGVASPPGVSQPAEPIPAGFRPVAVVECVEVSAILPGRALRLEERRQVAVTGLGGLMAALHRPSAPRPKGPLPACIVPASAIPWFVLVGANGQVIRPAVPVGLCGMPIEPVLASLSSLHWRVLSTTERGLISPRPPLHGAPIPDITPAISAARSGSTS